MSVHITTENCPRDVLHKNSPKCSCSFPVAQLVEHGVSNAKIMGSIPRETKRCINLNVTMATLNHL